MGDCSGIMIDFANPVLFDQILIVFLIVLGLVTAVAIVITKAQIGKRRRAEKKVKNVISQKKSSEVRLGKIGENMAPFFSGWPYDPNKFRFLGNPVDGIQFEDDEIIFVEIKTGKARLTNSQKSVKQLVQEGKVRFATFRVNEEGCTLKVEE